MNKVYQHGDELFVTLDATPRMRNLRTGLTITPRVPFKYLGEMPQVGQVWVGKRTGGLKTVKGFAPGRVQIEFEWSGSTRKGEVPLEVFLQNHRLKPDPFAWIADVVNETFEQFGKAIKELVDDGHLARPTTPFFATGHKDALNAKAADRGYELRDYQKAALDKVKQYCKADVDAQLEDALTRTAAKQHAWERLKKYCMADVEAGLYMAPDGKVFRVNGTCPGWVGLSTANETLPSRCVREAEFNAKYRALPIPGQLWAKGSRYVTVDRVEDGRVYYTDGSSGLRRFLNEYCRVAFKPGQFGTPDTLVLDFAAIEQRGARQFGTTSSVPPRPFLRPLCKPCHDRQKVEELARGHKSGTQGLKDFGAQVQRHGRMLRPTPIGKPCPNAKVAERTRFHEYAEDALLGNHFSVVSTRPDGNTRIELTTKEKFIEFCRAVASL